MMAFSTVINGRAVTAAFDLQDLRSGDREDGKNLGRIQIVIEMSIDGQKHNILLQCDSNDGILELAPEEALNDECHEAAARALGCSEEELEFYMKDYLENALEDVIEAAQAVFDEYIDGEVANADTVSEAEMVTGFELECDSLWNGWGFTCNGDGYLTIYHLDLGERAAVRYRLNADLVERLCVIKDETLFNGVARTFRVLAVFE